jgi:hypothetical protein
MVQRDYPNPGILFNNDRDRKVIATPTSGVTAK